MHSALPLANNAARDPVTALAVRSQLRSGNTSQGLTQSSAMCKESQTKQKRKSYKGILDVLLNNIMVNG